MSRGKFILLFWAAFLVLGLYSVAGHDPVASGETTGSVESNEEQTMTANNANADWKAKNKDYWKSTLSPEQYHVLREAGTERAFTGAYHDHKEPGVYKCAACGQALFKSEAKYDSGSGWPSFFEAVNPEAVSLHEDNTLWMKRTEIRCSRCDSHLGHIFDDGPEPTGKRYCVNSASLEHEGDK